MAKSKGRRPAADIEPSLVNEIRRKLDQLRVDPTDPVQMLEQLTSLSSGIPDRENRLGDKILSWKKNAAWTGAPSWASCGEA